MSSLRKEIFRITPERKKEYEELQKGLRKESTQLKSVKALEMKVNKLEDIIRAFENTLTHLKWSLSGIISDNEEQYHQINILQKQLEQKQLEQ